MRWLCSFGTFRARFALLICDYLRACLLLVTKRFRMNALALYPSVLKRTSQRSSSSSSRSQWEHLKLRLTCCERVLNRCSSCRVRRGKGKAKRADCSPASIVIFAVLFCSFRILFLPLAVCRLDIDIRKLTYVFLWELREIPRYDDSRNGRNAFTYHWNIWLCHHLVLLLMKIKGQQENNAQISIFRE